MKRIKLCLLVSLGLCWANFAAFGQQERSLTRKGNGFAKKGEWAKADEKYEQAVIKKPGMPEAVYNWGYSLYHQEKYEEAAAKFSDAGNFTSDSLSHFKTRYNMGNALLKQQKYAESAEAYKQALRLKPGDSAAQYNLSYALMKMRDKQNNQQNQQNQNQQNQDQNQSQDQKEQQQKEKQEQEQQQKQPQPQNLSKEQAEKLLEALRREEQKLQEKKSKEKKGVPYKSEKDW